MTDDNPLPNPRRSPDSEPPLPAWMTLPGSLAQPGAPELEAEPAATPAEEEPGREGPGSERDAEPVGSGLEDAEPPGPELDGAGSAGRGAAELGANRAPEEAAVSDVEHAESSNAGEEASSEAGSADAGLDGAGSAGRGAGELGARRAPEEPAVTAIEQVEASAGAEETLAEVEQAEASSAADEVAGDDGAGGSGVGPTLEAALEAILLVVDEPVAEVTLAQVLERPTHEVSAALRELAAEYTAAGRGFDLREVAGGWRFYTRADCAQLVERFVRDGQQTRLTQAALETLAVVAYRQPVSRARVAAVRGVNSDGVMRTLVARGLVEEAGTDPESQAVLYRTSSYFLERLGLRDLSELPELAPFLPDDVENLEETTK